MTPETTMSDEEAVEILAPRLKWKFKRLSDGYFETWDSDHAVFRRCTGHQAPSSKHPILRSRDALDPVLRGLSPVERKRLHAKLIWDRPANLLPEKHAIATSEWTWHLLTLPVADLARAIASVISEKPVN